MISTTSGRHAARFRRLRSRWARAVAACSLLLGSLAIPATAHAQETVCAKVKIEVKQELTLERQAFDAEMKINNTTTSDLIQNVSVVVKVSDELGTPVEITDDPNNLAAKFFLRISNKQNISDVDGTGTVNPATTSVINWLIIPAPGAAGTSPLGKKYLIGATLKYRYAGEDHTLDVSPDVVTVKPLPLLTLDYFLTQDVIGDDPLTPEIEATEPFTLGVRIKNNGQATARHLKIDSAQPKIVENQQGLLINFKLTGSFVDDLPAQNTLLIDFGDIPAAKSKTGRWLMESTLAGKFTEFSAKFTHADELGGQLTSIMQATNAHLLVRDVRVDLTGRDNVRDFLALDGDVTRVYESEGLDTVVTDRSAAAQLTAGTGPSGNASYRLVIPPTDGFVYVRLPDPFNGSKALGTVMRGDAKAILPENAWLSKTRNLELKKWEYWVNLFDVNTPGVYDTEFQAPPAVPRAPVLQFIANHTVKETHLLSYLVEASSPDGHAVSLSAAPLPAGATFTVMAPDPATPALARAVFQWTPPKGSAGHYLLTYTASDGSLSASRSASIRVDPVDPPPGPGTPAIVGPLSGAQVAALRPTFSVQASPSPQDPSTQIAFELYRDEAMTQPVASALVAKAPGGETAPPTEWQPPLDLDDNTAYWWRARAFDGQHTYSPWADARFFVNLFNDPPEVFNLSNPAPGAEVAQLQPQLAWTNSSDRDGDALSYTVAVFRNAALTDPVIQVADLPPGPDGSTRWTVAVPLDNHVRYYWRVTAIDAHGAQTSTPARSFVVDTGNTAPTAPAVLSPAAGSRVSSQPVALTVRNSSDADQDPITYVFELDSVNTFDSGEKRSSGPVVQGAGSSTSWSVGGLVEDRRYWWRVKADDGRAASAWVGADFRMNANDRPPPVPTVKNPGDGAWTNSLQPTLEANPVIDPDGDAPRYTFEVYRDAALRSLAAKGVSETTAWTVPVALADKTTYWWRVRAGASQGQSSAWSPAAVLFVSTGGYQAQNIQLTTPGAPMQPTLVGGRYIATLHWEGTNPNLDPTVALYWSTANSGYAGTLIADGLKQHPGTHSGTYDWDVTDMPPGAYYVYGLIYDSKGMGRAYAPGAVVIANPRPSGSIVVTGDHLSTREDGNSKTFTVRLGSAPGANVTVPISSTNRAEGLPSPAALLFTPQNWASNQTVTVTGQDDCWADGTANYQLLVGKASSLDPNYMGLSGRAVNASNADMQDKTGSTSSPDIHICRYTLVSQRQLAAKSFEYVFSAMVSNSGVSALGLSATLAMPAGVEVVDGRLLTGAVAQGETVKPVDTVAIRTSGALSNPVSYLQKNARWSVVIRR